MDIETRFQKIEERLTKLDKAVTLALKHLIVLLQPEINEPAEDADVVVTTIDGEPYLAMSDKPDREIAILNAVANFIRNENRKNICK